MAGGGSGERARLRWACRLGEICGRAAGRPDDPRGFMEAVILLTGACAGFLGLSDAQGEYELFGQGLCHDVLAEACAGGTEPPALRDAGGIEPVRLLSGALSALSLRDPHLRGPLLRVRVEDAGIGATLALCFGPDDMQLARDRAELVIDLRAALLSTLLVLGEALGHGEEAPMEVAALGAWSRCNVPLLFLDPAGGVVAANPAAWRKLELAGDHAELPPWLRQQVEERIDGLARIGGLPDGVSGDYAWVEGKGGDGLYRVGLAPVSGSASQGAAEWLLSVESGGPTTIQRVAAAAVAFGLTPREADVLSALAEGLSNRLIADAIDVSEATVKFHLVSVMRKAHTSNRTGLLARLYSLTV